MKKTLGVIFAAVGMLSGNAMGATCTSITTGGSWTSSKTWSCVGAPAATTPNNNDIVVLAVPVQVPNTITVAGLTINNGVTLNTGSTINVAGDVVNNGTFSGGGTLQMTGANTTLSGTGTFSSTRLYVNALNVSLAAGSSMNLSGSGQIRVGRNGPASFIVDGQITGTGMAAGNRALRVYGTSTATINGTINTPNGYIRVAGGITNNGTIAAQYLRSDSAAATWTQGTNANLTLTQASSWTGKLDAQATGNTVTYNTPAAPLATVNNTYWNLAGTGVTCPTAFIIRSSSPCGPAVQSITLTNPNPTNMATASWTVVFSAAVTGVDAGDFSLASVGVTGAAITSVTGNGTTWTVSATTGTGNGTLGLNLVDNDTIKDGANKPLGGVGAGNGNFTGPIYTVDKSAQVINTYYPGTASVAKGATTITLGAASGATTPIAVGDLVLIVQMQDATINATNSSAYGDGVAGDPGQGSTAIGNSGLYEYAVAASAVPITGGTLTLACASGTINAYTNANATAAQGQRRFQVIRVPVYANYTLAPVTAAPWDGTRGGVLAFDVTGTLDLGGLTVDVDGKGFRGGAARGSLAGTGTFTDYVTPFLNGANGSKGEGVAGTPQLVINLLGVQLNTGLDGYPSGSFARGAPGNAGGGGTDLNPPANDQNSGGGGGGNSGSGGIGGIGWCSGFSATAPYYGCGKSALFLAGINPNGSTGGFGGAGVAGLGANRLTLGGGGGAATTNNGTGAKAALSSSGAPGGGMILVRAGSITGNGTFNANGANGDSTVGNDGSGGGGGGGVVLVSAGSGTAGLTVNVRGGTGGSNLLPASGVTSTPHGTGGGGGGGFAIVSGAPAACDPSGGAAGVTYNNGTLFGNYGAMGGGPGSCNTTLSALQIPGATLGGGSACGMLLDHFAIDVGASPASTCAPRTVGITVKDAANNTYTNYAGTVTITTSSGHGDWSINTANGTLNNGAADDGAANYTFVAADNGSILLDLSNSHADTLVVTVADSASPVASASAAINFADNVFLITPTSCTGSSCVAPATPSEELVAGRAHGMQVALWTKDATGNCAVNTNYNGDVSLKAWIVRDATNDPSGAAPVLNSTIAGVAAVSLPNGTPGISNTQLRFTNGVAPFSLGASDVGKYAVELLDSTGGFAVDATTATAKPIQGSSNLLTVRPFALDLRAVSMTKPDGTIANNPAANTATGTLFTCAGCNFSATVAAVQWESIDDANNDGLPDTGADLSTNGVAASFKWPGTINATTPITPVGGTVGTITNGGFVAADFTNGAATLSTVQYGEVGSATLQAQADANLLGTANVTVPSAQVVVGRFIPHHFDVSVTNTTLAPSCGTFTYMAQDFGYAAAPNVTITARNAGSATTTNYKGAWWHLNGLSNFVLGNDATNPAKALSSGVTMTTGSVAPAHSAFTIVGNGVGTTTLSGTFRYLRSAANTAPFTPAPTISFNVQDTDGAAFGGAAPGTFTQLFGFPTGQDQVRSGRAYAQDVYGTIGNLNDQLSMPVVAQYFDGTSWVNNVADGCSGAPTTTKVDDRIQTTATSNALVAGVGSILFKVTGGTPGRSTITFDWTAQPWFGPVGTPPTTTSTTSATATFGVYRGDRRIIHWQEL